MVKASLPALIAALLGVALVNASQAQPTTLYDFWSPTCGPCRRMEPTVARLISAGFPVQKINIMGSSEERAIAAQYHVQRVPCFVMVAHGQEVDRVVGSTSYSRLEQMVRRASTPASSTDMPVARSQSPDALPPDSPWARHAREMEHTSPPAIAWPPTAAELPAATVSFAADNTESRLAGSSIYGRTSAAVKPQSDISANHRFLIEASVRIRVGDATLYSWGTGTIVDKRSGEALVVTCGHLFREMHEAAGAEQQVEVELFEWTPSGPRVAARVPGEVISYDLDSDVGLVSIRPGRDVPTAAVAGPDVKLAPSLKVCSVGCDHGANPTVIPTQVTAINRFLGPPNIVAAGAPVVGRSGGGLFNSANELIGVCNAAEDEGNQGLYAGLESVHRALDQIGLSEIYLRTTVPQTATASGPSATPLSAGETAATIIRGQEPGQPDNFSAIGDALQSQPSAQPNVHSAVATPPQKALNPMEEAAWDEIMTRAAEAEVVCIVRPREPDGQSEIITLNQVSTEFVLRLRQAESAGGNSAESESQAPNIRSASSASSLSSPWGAAR